MIQKIASYILFSLMSIVMLAMGAYSNSDSGAFPTRKSLEVISRTSAVLVITVTIAVLTGLGILVVDRLIQ